MIKRLLTALLFCTVAATTAAQEPPAKAAEESAPEAEAASAEADAWAAQLWSSLDRKTGAVPLPNGVATLQIPENFYYLGPADAEKVLVEVWGNPPGTSTLGMIFPADMTPFDEGSWAVTVEYEEDGYVSDADADNIDYNDLLKQMQEDTAAVNKYRAQEGYEAITLVGWAANPFYDKTTHKMHWAKELKFGDAPENTLNYNIRVLGRKGVLVLNFIAGMEQKPVIEANLEQVLAMAEFNDGSRYADFNPELDQVAAYGLGALVAGKVLAKTGFLALALVFLKKFGIYIVIALGALGRKLFMRKKADAE